MIIPGDLVTLDDGIEPPLRWIGFLLGTVLDGRPQIGYVMWTTDTGELLFRCHPFDDLCCL